MKFTDGQIFTTIVNGNPVKYVMHKDELVKFVETKNLKITEDESNALIKILKDLTFKSCLTNDEILNLNDFYYKLELLFNKDDLLGED